MKTIAVIPCYNEEQHISELVFQFNKCPDFLGIVCDDNSTDKTVAKAEEAGAYVIRNFGKRGYGSNIKSGIDVALIKECDIVVTLDGDGQHSPEEIPFVVEPIERNEADVVAGSRFLSGGNKLIPFYRRLGIRMVTWLYNVGNKHKLSDAQCGFRAYRQEVLRGMGIAEDGWAFSVETLIKARALGFRIKEVPVSVLYHRQYSQNSTLNPIRQGLSVAFGVIKWRILVELLGRMR